MVRGAVGDSQLVAEPAVETLLGVSQLLPPIDPVPGDLTQAPVDSKSKRDWKYPYWIEKQNTRRHEDRVTTRSLLIVVYEDIVPRESADVECVECAENPEEWNTD